MNRKSIYLASSDPTVYLLFTNPGIVISGPAPAILNALFNTIILV